MRLRRKLAGAASLAVASLAGCTGSDESDQQATAKQANMTYSGSGGNSSDSQPPNGTDGSEEQNQDVDIGPREGESPPSDNPNSDIIRGSFAGLDFFIQVTSNPDVDAIAMISPMGHQLGLKTIQDGDESVRFNLVSETHGLLYPPGSYRIVGYDVSGSENNPSYERLESHAVDLQPELQLDGVENMGAPGKVRLLISNTGTAPYPVSEYRVSRFFRTVKREEWTEPENSSVVVRPNEQIALDVSTKTQRQLDEEREYEQLQEEFCNGETQYRQFEFRSSKMLSNRGSTTVELTLEGEAIQTSQSGSQPIVRCNQITVKDEEENE